MANVPANPATAALANVAALKANLQAAKANVPASGQSGILQFTKHGDWVFGKEQTEITVDDLFAVNPASFVNGFICWPEDEKLWKNGPIDEVTVPLGHPVPLKHELAAHDGGKWTELTGFSLRFVEGAHKGKEGKFTTTSKGGMTAVGALLDAVIAQLDNDPSKPVPIVSAGADSYTHKTWGKTFTPVLDVDGWADMNGGTEAPAEEQAAAAEEPEQVAQAPEPEAAPEPARRRRRA